MNVLIVEDEMMAQANLARALTQHFPDVRIVGTTGSVRETVLWLRTPGNSADVILWTWNSPMGIASRYSAKRT